MARDEKAYIAEVAELAASPEVQALVKSWGPPTPRQLAVIARVFGGQVAAASKLTQPEHEEAA